ncbi:glycine--tRNA ligase, chloroplastic/mitochondrial 2 isoform X1 [Benincasa hispida]|uniref:glycine--tRNA ligase, chloroplastic/mitochondrial 2 isoform X1 n=1 Tax=Benincasa hispida TaxID=102211 RepID=UPI0019010B8D|nr:glycine--tRNA ligase, chloroplastic/mitochondrial 2 isoform X1 [Benincasa hispida]
MAILALPLLASFLKHHTYLLSIRSRKSLSSSFCKSPYRRQFNKTCASAISPSTTLQHSSSDSKTYGSKSSVLTFQQAIQRLQEYWASVGCAVMQCSNTEVGAGTMNPLTFLRVLGPEPWNVAYVEPSIRPDDSRYGENPNRLQRHTQFQVILKPDPGNSQDLFIQSLSALGIDVAAHDIRFVEDNWESPVLGAWGLGWEIWMDGMEITQFTYFQQAGSQQLLPVSVEITYGLERILMLLQGVNHFKKIQYADGITYGELFLENEKEMSAYYLEHANVHQVQKHFDIFEEEAHSLLALGLAIPAYDQVLKASHAFNILDSRGFIGVTERARYFGRMRSLARHCAQLWLKTRESLGHPLGVVSDPVDIVCPKELLDAAVKKVHEDARWFVLEIGTEEIPPKDVVDASQQLKIYMLQLLEKHRLSHGNVQAFGTPRRLVVTVESLCSKQVEKEIEVRGPPVSKAFDDQGNPTKAAEGFCRRYSISRESLYRKIDGKTEYLYASVMESSRLALEIFSENLPAIIAKISFPKSMRWNSQVVFSRPIRWILALHGDVVVPFSYAGVLSGNISYGLRNTSTTIVEVDSAESFMRTLKDAKIDLEVKDRKRKILDQSSILAQSVKGKTVIHESLLDEVVNLVETPVSILGKFNDSFLELPEDLLTMVMQKHQKYFSIRNPDGKLMPYFIAVANGEIDDKVVRKGNEAVLRARYEDAKFFYETDTSKRFSQFRNQLSGILFHEKLGSMLDKMTRMEAMVVKLSLAMGISQDLLQIIQEAASLAMSDLATAVVTEFTSLAGIMARHYALREGFSEQIAEALFEITLPRFSGDILPKSDVGIVLAVADRLDSLVGLFAVGCQPSSTSDPFGLRRISYGLVQILVEKDKNLDLGRALRLAADIQPIKVDTNVIDNVILFVTRRLEQFLVDKGLSPEIVRSVLAERSNFPCLAAKTAHKMNAMSKGDLFPKIVEAYARPTRIISGKDVDPAMEVDEAAFESNEERALWNTFLSIKNEVHPGIEVDEFFEISSKLIEPLEDFFERVFVMVENEKIRKNRLALLKKIADLPRGIAVLSLLSGF